MNSTATSVPADRAPLTARGRRTRASVLEAATKVFIEQGYTATRMSDIATTAGVAHGTVYTYFDTKESVLDSVVEETVADLLASLRASTAADPLDRIADANARYLAAYRQHARLLRVVEEAAYGDDRFRDVLVRLRRTHVRRVAQAVRRLQDEGLALPEPDPDASAAALCAMVEGFARHWLANGEQHDEAVATQTLTTLWARALGLAEQ
jgi:AcrR family transcriptional regulator